MWNGQQRSWRRLVELIGHYLGLGLTSNHICVTPEHWNSKIQLFLLNSKYKRNQGGHLIFLVYVRPYLPCLPFALLLLHASQTGSYHFKNRASPLLFQQRDCNATTASHNHFRTSRTHDTVSSLHSYTRLDSCYPHHPIIFTLIVHTPHQIVRSWAPTLRTPLRHQSQTITTRKEAHKPSASQITRCKPASISAVFLEHEQRTIHHSWLPKMFFSPVLTKQMIYISAPHSRNNTRHMELQHPQSIHICSEQLIGRHRTQHTYTIYANR